LLYNEYLDFHAVKTAGAWCCPTNAIFRVDVEERAEVYLCFSMNTLNFMWLNRPGRCAVLLMPSLVTTLKKAQRYTFYLNSENLENKGVNAAGAWCCPTNAIFSDDVEVRAEVYLCCTMSYLTFMGLKGLAVVLSN
jgi:hypothetical protein